MTSHNKRSYLFPAIAMLAVIFGVLAVAGHAFASPAIGEPQASASSNGSANPAQPGNEGACQPNYIITQSVGAIIANPGTSLAPGSQCDDCGVNISLPFPYTLYDQTFTNLTASSNGQLDFGNPADRSYSNTCLPDPYTNYAIFPSWIDLTMESQNIHCNYYPGNPQNCGIYTAVTGAAPNRIFNIEYRAIDWDTYGPVHFEVRLYENQTQFDVIYAEMNLLASPASTAGVERTGGIFTQYQCPGSPNLLVTGLQLSFTLTDPCGSPTDTPTQTPIGFLTDTPTQTPTDAPSNTRTPTRTSTSVPTGTATNTPIPPTNTATRTSTNTPTGTFTSIPTSTPTNTPTGTFTSIPTNTNTFTVTSTNTPTNTSTSIPTSTPTDTPTNPPTSIPSNTATNTPNNTPTRTFTSVSTSTPTNTSLPTSTPTLTGTAVPGAAILSGHVLLQGRPAAPSPRWVIPVVGALRLASGGANYNFATVTDQSGYFTINTNLPPGDYLWYVKNPQTLANGGSATLGADVSTVEMGIILEGDANNDNCVGISDFNILKPSYGRSPGDIGYDARADFNGDSAISVLDFNLMKGNYGRCGAPPIAGATPSATSTETPMPAAAVLVGHITMQGRLSQPNPRQSVPVSVTLRINGGNADQYNVTTDQSGFFTITMGVAPGNYAWRVKHAQTMANVGSATLAAGTNNVEMGLLIEGDANNDNCVTAPDFNILKPTYGKSLGDPGYDARADFNGDNQINVGDFNLLKPNFGVCGPGPISNR